MLASHSGYLGSEPARQLLRLLLRPPQADQTAAQNLAVGIARVVALAGPAVAAELVEDPDSAGGIVPDFAAAVASLFSLEIVAFGHPSCRHSDGSAADCPL